MYNHKICGIYKITNIIDNKAIIGQSVNILNRWKAYKGLLRNGHYYNQPLQKAWNNNGESNFKFEILLECTEENLNKEEKRLIAQYNTTDKSFGYNIEPGGNIHGKNAETRKKLSEAGKLRKGMFTMSDEQKKKISESMRGHSCSKATREKISQKHKSKKISEKTKEKMAISHLALESNKGKNHWNYGKHTSEEVKKKMSDSNKGKHFHSKDTNYNKKINEKLGEALKWANISEKDRNSLAKRYTSNALTQP